MLPPTTSLMNLLNEPTPSRPVYDVPPLIVAAAPGHRLRALVARLSVLAARMRFRHLPDPRRRSASRPAPRGE
jgi:hypothetical protein